MLGEKSKKNIRRILSMFLIFLEIRFAGNVSDIINHDSVSAYNDIIEDFSEYLKSQNVDDVQEIFEYYNYALWNGYLSHNHSLKFSDDRNVFIKNHGLSCINGNGVCLNYSDMLTDIFKQMGFNAYNVVCYVNPVNTNIENIRTNKDITRTVNFTTNNYFSVVTDLVGKVVGNHAITCVEYRGKYFFFDPTNLIYLNKDKLSSVSIINGEGNINLKYLATLILEDFPVFKVCNSNNSKRYNELVYKKEQLKIDIDTLEQFYQNHNSKYESIHNELEDKDSIIVFGTSLAISYITFHSLLYILKKILYKIQEKELQPLLSQLKNELDDNITEKLDILRKTNILEKKGSFSSIYKNKDLVQNIIRKSSNLLLSLTENYDYISNLLCIVLKDYGYKAFSFNSKRYINNHYDKKVNLICICDEKDYYFYDYQYDLLLTKYNNKSLKSIIGAFDYEIDTSSLSTKLFYQINDYLSNEERIYNEIKKSKIKTLEWETINFNS